jgi:hypothetical protein
MGMIPARTLDQAITYAEEFLPEEWRTYVMPEGGSVLPVV